jgi:hypothetical protein
MTNGLSSYDFKLDEWSTITWNCGFDVSPETLYERATGKQIHWLEQNEFSEIAA